MTREKGKQPYSWVQNKRPGTFIIFGKSSLIFFNLLTPPSIVFIQVLNKMRTTMRQRMEKDLREIQDELNNEDESCFHRQLDADVLKKEFQLATYKASKLK